MKQRFPKWDNLKCVLIFLVVLGHCIETFIDDSYMFKRMWLMIYTIHMPLFIFVSGLFAKSTLLSKEKVKSKVFMYLKYYFIYKVLLFAVKLVITGEGSFSLLSEVGVPWYMFAMAAYILITYIARNIKPAYLFTLSIILACVIGYDREINDFLMLARIINFYPFFLMGYYAKQDMKILESSVMKKICSLVVLAAFVGIVWVNITKAYEFRPLLTGRNTYYAFEIPGYGILYRLAHYVLASIIGLCIIYIVPERVNILTFIGKKSLYIYVIHGVLLKVLRSFQWEQRLMDNFAPTIWKAMVLATSVVIVGLCCTKVAEKAFAFIINRKYVKDNIDNYELDYSVFSMPPRDIYKEYPYEKRDVLKESKQ